MGARDPARVVARRSRPHQLETWLLPTIRGERTECYAITEEFAGSDPSQLATTARRDGDAMSSTA
ncbi:MAG: hypothetical protein U0R78_05265 [Nocardioidaceae bacterium]